MLSNVTAEVAKTPRTITGPDRRPALIAARPRRPARSVGRCRTPALSATRGRGRSHSACPIQRAHPPPGELRASSRVRALTGVALTPDQVSRSASVSSRRSKLTRRIVLLGELAALLGLKQRRLWPPFALSVSDLRRLGRKLAPRDTCSRDALLSGRAGAKVSP